ncbi:MAG: hypothetical protein ACOZQL_06100 [Myxococcota bacterium]
MEEPALIELGTRLTPEALRVYADRLLEQGDAHGEFIALQCARAREARPSAREEQLRVEVLEPRLRDAVGPSLRIKRWEMGLVSEVELQVDRPPDLALASLARRAEGVGLRRLQVETTGWDAATDLSPLWGALAKGPRFPRLLELGVQVADSANPSIRIGEVEPLYRAYPGLRVLELHGVDHHLGRIELPELRRFSASLLRPETIPSLAQARWPRLEALELEFGPAPAESEPVFADLLATSMSPALRRVRVKSPWPEFFRAALPRSPLGAGRLVEV